MDSVTDVFLRTSIKLRKLAIQHAYTADPAILRNIELHIGLLASFAEGSRYKLRFLGIALSAGTIRTVLVTTATLIGCGFVVRSERTRVVGDDGDFLPGLNGGVIRRIENGIGRGNKMSMRDDDSVIPSFEENGI